jgi:hypothetical protein
MVSSCHKSEPPLVFFQQIFIGIYFKAKDYDKNVTHRAEDRIRVNLNRTISSIPHDDDDEEEENEDEELNNIKYNNLFPNQNDKQNRYKQVKQQQQQQKQVNKSPQQNFKRSTSLQERLDNEEVKVKSKAPVKKIPSSEPKPKLDLSKKARQDKENFETILRIRDPVTSKVRTINLKDSEIDDLAKRHEEEKSRVSKLMNQESSREKVTKAVVESPGPQQKQLVFTDDDIDTVEDLINRHQRERSNAEQIKVKETDNLNKQNESDDHFDDIEL